MPDFTAARTRLFYIDGAWVAPLGRTVDDVINPATGKAIAKVALGTAADVGRAVAAAKRAFPAYASLPPARRLDLLEALLRIYRRRYEEMAQTITAEMGAPISMSRAQQADVGIGHLEGFIAALRTVPWRQDVGNGDVVLREPIGVCGLITPWNWPVNQIALKVIPALATGCTCVLKPSELTPLSASLYAEMIDEAGFPPGVFNLVHGDGPGAGAALATHEDVAMVSFTGSTRAGIAISQAAAPGIRRVALELGGKSPNLIFEDADLARATAAAVAECFNNSGQSCDAPTRLLVQASVYDKVVALAKIAGEAVCPGDPSREGDHLGPVVSEAQRLRTEEMILSGIEEGARLLTGGPGRPADWQKGFYVRPTIFADVTPGMRICREEIFGPVLVILPFGTEEEGIALANDTPYGLAAYVQTGDPARAGRVAGALRVGMVHVNGAPHRYGSPFGGFKQSGNGREGGRAGLEEFLEIKVLHLP